jgi:glucosyl-dolichyl phosphate glucuronosyltransferase
LSEAPPPLLSVVVCTHERPDELERCLGGLAALRDPVEAIVVDSASKPDCRGLVESFAGRIPSLRYLYEDRPGLSRARNRGLAEASADIVAFFYDDALPARDWAGRLAAPFADPAVGCVGGTCRPDFRAARPRWLSDRLLQYAGITRFGATPRDARSSAEYPFGANVAFRREALLRRGGFDEALGRIGSSLLSGEEWAAIEGLLADGWRVRLEPSAIVDHAVAPNRCESGYYWRRLWWQGISRARGERSWRTTVRLLGAAPVRALGWATTGDRFFLYRTAETAGYLSELARRR